MMYEKNLAAWKERYGETAALKIEELQEKKEEPRVYPVTANDGNQIIEIVSQERKWHLNSIYEPEKAAQIYAMRYEGGKSFWVYLVFGISDGRHIRELLKQLDETNKLFVYEPDLDIFKISMENFPLDDIIRDKRVYICIDDIVWVGQRAGNMIDYCNRELIEFCILPGYDILYHDLCEQYMDMTIREIQKERIHKNTYEHFNRNYPYNILFNMKNMLFHNNICQIKEKLMEKDLSGIPAIIVAAGPSLDKNIHELKKAEGRAFIIVVDAAIKRVLKEGIRPDMVVTEDALVPDRFFEAEGMDEVFWMAERVTKPEVMRRYGKKVFYYGHTLKYWDKRLIETLGYRYPDLLTGGSVAHTAYGAAVYFGFRTIILIGQDLAFTGGKSHTSGIHDGKEENDTYIKGRSITTVKDADGNLLETDAQMKWYKEWYESEFNIRKDYLEKVIDATEGGAKIEGTIIQPFAQTIEEECQGHLNMWELENELTVPFTKEQQDVLIQELYQMKQETERLKREIQSMLKQYEKLQRIGKGNGNETEIRQLLQEITEQNEKIDKEDLMELVALYAKKEEFELQEHIYKDEEIEIADLAGRAIRLYEGYLKGIDMLEEDLTELYG